MRRLIVTGAALFLLSAPAFAVTDAECAAMWKNADTNSDGKVDAVESSRFAASMRVAGKTIPSDTPMTDTMFMENCRGGVFTASAMDEGAPLEGANSFTEDQAKDRALAAGFTDVSALTKDDKGIWRGTAMRDGASVKVAVDYKGNVVAN
ncbi:hypothetical protein BH10PSE7_BH10PSE7_44580 [soil metagenome]